MYKRQDDLTAADHITSQHPYSYTARDFRTFFFDVCNQNNGRTWSTPFVVDDPKLYVINSQRVESIVKRQEQAAIQQAERQRKAAEQQAARQKQLEERREAQREASANRTATRPQQKQQRNSR